MHVSNVRRAILNVGLMPYYRNGKRLIQHLDRQWARLAAIERMVGSEKESEVVGRLLPYRDLSQPVAVCSGVSFGAERVQDWRCKDRCNDCC